MSDDSGRHVRRKRYRGSHPRAFSEKYKELHPEAYPKDMERVLSRGDTPAGSHRSICVREVLEALTPKKGELAVDATLGYGGHAKALLEAILPGGRLLGLDLDAAELSKTAQRLAAAGFPAAAFTAVRSNFARLPEALAAAGFARADVFFADLGVSSMQIDDPSRGFSFKRNGPLDMRMDTSRGYSAQDYLKDVSEDALCDAIRLNADEANAEKIAAAVCGRRGLLATTRDLAEAVCSAFPNLVFKDPDMKRILQRVFQAIRIEVNGEFANLESLLAELPSCLAPGARAAILAFHSGEDRRVEASFREGFSRGIYSAIAEEPVRPGPAERRENPRSSAAKLRWAVRSAAGA